MLLQLGKHAISKSSSSRIPRRIHRSKSICHTRSLSSVAALQRMPRRHTNQTIIRSKLPAVSKNRSDRQSWTNHARVRKTQLVRPHQHSAVSHKHREKMDHLSNPVRFASVSQSRSMPRRHQTGEYHSHFVELGFIGRFCVVQASVFARG